MLVRWSSPTALLGGVLWTMLWVLDLLTHGPGPEDYQGTIFGLTHHAYGKVLVVPLALCAVGLVGLHVPQQDRSGRLGAMGFTLGLGAFGVMGVGVALLLWPISWDSYQVDWQTPLAIWGGIAASLASLALTIGLVLFGAGVLRARVWPRWVALPLIVGPLSTVPWLHMAPWGGLFGLAWLLPGCALGSAGEAGCGSR